MNLRLFVAVGVVGLLSISQTGSLASASDYPERQVTLVAPWPPGGAIDALCRILGVKLANRLGKPIVVENRPGAGSIIGVASVARAAPDGYTLVMGGSSALATMVSIHKKLPYDPTRDFAPVAVVAHVPFVLVAHPSLGVSSASDLVELAKRKNGTLSFASGGPGTPHHLYGELFKRMTGIEMVHIPYKGSAPALTDVVAGHVSMTFADIVAALPLIREGKVRALGVSSATRVPSASEIPTIAEAGVPGFEAVSWVMVAAPANTPVAIIKKLHAEFKDVVRLSDVEPQLVALGMTPVVSPDPERLQSFIDDEIARWRKIITELGLAGSE
jgi:tripartite-type tricarboxylate transporter receptor subunit TctC